MKRTILVLFLVFLSYFVVSETRYTLVDPKGTIGKVIAHHLKLIEKYGPSHGMVYWIFEDSKGNHYHVYQPSAWVIIEERNREEKNSKN